MWLIPSRERPHKVARFLAAYHRTKATTPVLVIVDSTDPRLDEYRELDCDLLVRPGESIGLAGKVTYAYESMAPRPWYGHLPDDCEPMTEGWDVAMSEACQPDRVAYCYHGVDGIIQHALPCIGAELLKKLGFFFPPGVEHYATDKFWHYVARQTKRLVWVEGHEIRLTDRANGESRKTWDEPKRIQKARKPEDEAAYNAFRKSPEFIKTLRRLKV